MSVMIALSCLIVFLSCKCYHQTYAVAPVKMSESPASNTAMVEHLYSFPHAVPSSICREESV